MPMLFISYKRDDKIAVTKIVDRLRKEFYFQIWRDAESIPGGADWRAEIRAGIDKCDLVLLMLTPDACASPQVKEEIDYAKSIGRRIVPLQLKLCSTDDLTQLGVEPLNFINFVASEHDGWEKLLSKDTLPPVLDRDRRRLDPTFNKLHTDYLRSLFARLSRVNLTYLLEAAPKETVTLMDIYVPLKLGVSFNIEVNDGELADWWLRDQDAPRTKSEEEKAPKPLPHTLYGFTPQGEPLKRWEARMREGWAEFKARYAEDQAKKAEKDRKPLADGTYFWNRLESEVAPALMPHLVLTGDPGSGKSTLMQHLALCMAGDMLAEGEEAKADLNRLGFWPLPAYTPVFIELRALVRTAFPGLKDEITLAKLYCYLETEQLQRDGLTAYLPDLRDQMRDGDVMFFLDGLDEVPDAEKKQRRDQIKALAHLLRESFPKCRILITSRPYAYAGDWSLEGFGQVKLTALDPDRLEELALRLFRVVLGETDAETQAGEFNEAMENVPEELRSSPLFFTLMAAIWLNNSTKPAEERLPVRKGDIYRECVEMLIKRWTRKDLGGASIAEQIGLEQDQLRKVLEFLAYAVHSEAGDKDDAIFTGGKILDIALSLDLEDVKIQRLLEALAQRAGVIYAKAPNLYQFAHRSFQEHLSACHLTTSALYPAQFVANLREKPDLWRNVGELLPDEATRSKADLWKLVKELLPAKGTPLPTARTDPQWHCIAYAARLLTEHLPADDDRQELYRPRLRDLLAALVTVGALAPIERAHMGRILSDLGDPRPDVLSLDFSEDYWCSVPAGTYPLGSDEDRDNPKHTVTLEGFKIGKYPITYAQFQQFLDDPEGYANVKWWDGLYPDGISQQREGSGEQSFKFWNHPREKVSWYEAMAFCAWLTVRLRLPPGLVIRLPTEDEWEAAARGMDEQRYPYLGEYDATKGNTGDPGIGQTSAVGIFPDGVSPCGALDMSGNVLEWTLTEYKSKINNRYNVVWPRTLRGSAWGAKRALATLATSRIEFMGNQRLKQFGFRIVVGREILPASDLY